MFTLQELLFSHQSVSLKILLCEYFSPPLLWQNLTFNKRSASQKVCIPLVDIAIVIMVNNYFEAFECASVNIIFYVFSQRRKDWTLKKKERGWRSSFTRRFACSFPLIIWIQCFWFGKSFTTNFSQICVLQIVLLFL